MATNNIHDSGNNILVLAVLFLVLLVTLAVWAVVGFIFWIPLLVRATTVFSALVVHSAFSRQDPHAMRTGLEVASGFYFQGFRSAINVICRPVENARPVELHLGRVFVEVLWTGLFWSVALWIWSPAKFESLAKAVRDLLL